jgi:hypothetical protein
VIERIRSGEGVEITSKTKVEVRLKLRSLWLRLRSATGITFGD